LGQIIVSDASGEQNTLYVISHSQLTTNNLQLFDLPPVPPSGIFDALSVHKRNVEVLGTEARRIVISGASYPVEVHLEGVEARITDLATNGKIVDEIVHGNGVVKITNAAIGLIEIQSLDIPVTYELFQNYRIRLTHQRPSNSVAAKLTGDAIGVQSAG